MNVNERNAKTLVPPASPSMPSVRLTPFDVATIATSAIKPKATAPMTHSPTSGTKMPFTAKCFWM